MILSKASQRDDRAVILPPHLRGAVVKGLISRLAGGGLIAEVPAEPPLPVWRRDDDGVAFTLVVSDEGLRAIGVEVDTPPAEAPGTEPEGETGESAASAKEPDHEPEEQSPPGVRTGSKQAAIIALLQRDDGATMADLVGVTGWLPHTTRAALTGLRRKGFLIGRQRGEDGTSVYRISGGPQALAAAPDGPAETAAEPARCGRGRG